MFAYLMDHGLTREEYAFFMNRRVRYRWVMGNDYYITNEHLLTGPNARAVVGRDGTFSIRPEKIHLGDVPDPGASTATRPASAGRGGGQYEDRGRRPESAARYTSHLISSHFRVGVPRRSCLRRPARDGVSTIPGG